MRALARSNPRIKENFWIATTCLAASLAMTKWGANLQKSRHCEGFSPKQSTNATFESKANHLLIANLNVKFIDLTLQYCANLTFRFA